MPNQFFENKGLNMPIYEYRCEACGKHTELVQKFSDTPATDCPHCHKPQLNKLISAAAFHLKGTGWYVTDFKDKPQDKNATQKTENSTEKTTDTNEPTITSKQSNNNETPS